MDAAVIGPGIARTEESLEAVRTLIAEASCPLVLDATALQPDTLSLIEGKQTVITPHLGELERMEIAKEKIAQAAMKSGAVILLKDQVDTIVSPDGKNEEVHGGNAGLTVGGTGDVLAGFVCGLIAQGVPAFHASVTAATLMKEVGTLLFEKKGYAYTAHEIVNELPYLLQKKIFVKN